ncbi:DUF397 domain-containing protein [Streptomyces sp. NPDC059396]|uniref:DUF397 domain-containing protein n=1 Tax=Streptomyces sp. NPDC059396 TaxID=3346819 RepID=UPI0036B80A0E
MKSSHSGDGGNNCVEVSIIGQNSVALRDSTRSDRTVATGQAAFRALVDGLKSGGVTPPQV